MLFVQSEVIVENDTHTAIIGFVRHLIFKLGLFIFVNIKHFACTIILIHFLLEETYVAIRRDERTTESFVYDIFIVACTDKLLTMA